MRILVTGSAGHLGEALMRQLPHMGHDPVGLDARASPFTDIVGLVTDRALIQQAMAGIDGVLHTATLHKPHVATHTKQDFINTNIAGTLVLLEAAAQAGVARFVYSSTTSTFGAALSPPRGKPAAWIDETVAPVPKNIYGVSKTAAEDLCALFARTHGLACIVLRISRFFPEGDDNKATRDGFDNANAKANEFLFRRVDIQDVVLAHERALTCAPPTGFARFIISAPTPFGRPDLIALRTDPGTVVAQYFPDFRAIYADAGYTMFADIERVYVSARAQSVLGWVPKYGFGRILQQIAAKEPIGSALMRAVGIKGYHAETFADGPYPVE